MGLNTTNKMPDEVDRDWVPPIIMDEKVKYEVNDIWQELGLLD